MLRLLFFFFLFFFMTVMCSSVSQSAYAFLPARCIRSHQDGLKSVVRKLCIRCKNLITKEGLISSSTNAFEEGLAW